MGFFVEDKSVSAFWIFGHVVPYNYKLDLAKMWNKVPLPWEQVSSTLQQKAERRPQEHHSRSTQAL